MEITLDTWIISDTHFKHKNIVKYCNRPMGHNELMARNWHELVQPEDTVLHLGDLMVWYGDEDVVDAMEIAQNLPGKKFIIRGNHDHITTEEFAELGFTEVPPFIQKFGQNRVLFSHYPDHGPGWDINVHGHIHNNDHRDPSGNLINSSRYVNASIEMMDYKPVLLRRLL